MDCMGRDKQEARGVRPEKTKDALSIFLLPPRKKPRNPARGPFPGRVPTHFLHRTSRLSGNRIRGLGRRQGWSGESRCSEDRRIGGMRGLAGRLLQNRSRPHESGRIGRSEEHTSELQSPCNLVCRLLLEKKKNITKKYQDDNKN